MGLLDLIENTVSGLVQVAINAPKAVIGLETFPLDAGETVADGLEGVQDGLKKIGSDTPLKDTDNG